MNRLYLFTIFFVVSAVSHAQLGTGSLLFVGYNADSTDGFAIVTMDSIPPNTTIYFSDNEWNGLPIGGGGAFNNLNEGELVWTTDTTGISPCTVVVFNHTSDSSHASYGATTGSIQNELSLSGSNEVIYSYQGSATDSPTVFLSAIANDGFNMTNGTLDQTGLHENIDAVSISGDRDVMVYSGSTSCSSKVACTGMIVNSSNWATQNGSGNQAGDSVFPDFPVDVPASFGGKVLPVEFAWVEADIVNDQLIVRWRTVSEVHSDYFQVEYRVGNRWSILSTPIRAAGYSSVPVEYSYKTLFPNTATAIRVKEVDFDGTTQYSNAVVVYPAAVDASLYMTTSRQSLFIRIEPTFVNGNLTVINSLGQVVVKQRITNSGDYEIKLPRGRYFVALQEGRNLVSKQVVIQ
jgi:hypothetical protein